MENEITAEVSEVEESTLQGEATTPETQETTAPQGLTEAHVRQIMQEERQKIAEESAKAFRAMQSMTDKKARQVQGNALAMLSEMKATGAQFTPEMEREFVARTVNNYLNALNDEQPEAAQPETQRNDKSQFLDAAMDEVNGFIANNKVTLSQEAKSSLDAEWQKVKDVRSYTAFVKRIPEILQPKSDKTPPQVRMASVIGGKGSFTPSPESIAAELQKLLEHPHPKNLKKIEELQEKLKT
jgi:hypothetical protein